MFTVLTNKKLLLLLQCKLDKFFFSEFLKLIAYLVSAIITVLSNPCVAPSARTKMPFLLSSKFMEDLL